MLSQKQMTLGRLQTARRKMGAGGGGGGGGGREAALRVGRCFQKLFPKECPWALRPKQKKTLKNLRGGDRGTILRALNEALTHQLRNR